MEEFLTKSQPVFISAIVTFIVLAFNWVIKPLWESYFHNYKLRSNHTYEQKKKVKEAISMNKISLIENAETLNHRLWNFSKKIGEGWHFYDESKGGKAYYLNSFAYSFLAFFAWARKSEKEMIYIDSTVSEKEDLELIKYLKLMPQFFCNVEIFKGKGYDDSIDSDHFFRHEFNRVLDLMVVDGEIISFNVFLENKNKNDFNDYDKVYDYISSIEKNKKCLKWQSIQSFHFILMSFLTKFGYDFQKTSIYDLNKNSSGSPENSVIEGVDYLIKKMCLDGSEEIKNAVYALSKKH